MKAREFDKRFDKGEAFGQYGRVGTFDQETCCIHCRPISRSAGEVWPDILGSPTTSA